MFFLLKDTQAHLSFVADESGLKTELTGSALEQRVLSCRSNEMRAILILIKRTRSNSPRSGNAMLVHHSTGAFTIL